MYSWQSLYKKEREHALKKQKQAGIQRTCGLQPSETVGLLGGCTSIFPSVLWESMRMNDPQKIK